ncbi:Mitogen-activated protein kinase kinase kinase ANP1 [Apostasia shenzhenica]|uniref:Mitogen-activated protein kinase kinase kinase ANP1 n=1 Tax=Apostasia shenzhenica TaxID=1088818 RepID=A0A2I0B0Z7_9ASPA|nr:Mitogen-activated protein kinase kinase kinase ANP1 [Apostasia shenzhenica]
MVGGEWKFRRILGSGATSTVSLAASVPSGDLFAVKSSPVSHSFLLQREHAILSSLSSPHIIPCLGFDVSGDSCHLFLEYATGGALSDVAGCIEEPKMQAFSRQILLALSYLHSNGIAHCDVKGRNVLLCSNGCVKLADFGCARVVGGGDNGVVMGTPAFMAPEVARGEEQSFAGDIWALGCTVVEMATGGSPWPEISDPVAAIHRIGFSSDVPAMPAWVSGDAKDFVSRCLMRDPKQRWTAEELLRHPFMAVAAIETEKAKWVSPKSALDFGLWYSEAEDEEDEGSAVLTEDSVNRIRQMASAPSNWTWTGGWVGARGVADEFESPVSGGQGGGNEEAFSSSFVRREETEDVTEGTLLGDEFCKIENDFAVEPEMDFAYLFYRRFTETFSKK